MKTCTIKQWDAIKNLIDVNKANFKEVKYVPQDAINIGYSFAPYGDYNYFVTKDGEYVCTYYSIGD